MTLFDFLRRQELLRIEELETEVQNLSKYKGIFDIDNEIITQKAACEKDISNVQQQITSLENELDDLKAHAIYIGLKHQNELYSESLDLAEYGVYQPHFGFDYSKKFKNSEATGEALHKNAAFFLFVLFI